MDIIAEKYGIMEQLMLLEDEETLMEIKELLSARQQKISKERRKFLEARLEEHRKNPESSKAWRTSIKTIANKYGLASNC